MKTLIVFSVFDPCDLDKQGYDSKFQMPVKFHNSPFQYTTAKTTLV